MSERETVTRVACKLRPGIAEPSINSLASTFRLGELELYEVHRSCFLMFDKHFRKIDCELGIGSVAVYYRNSLSVGDAAQAFDHEAGGGGMTKNLKPGRERLEKEIRHLNRVAASIGSALGLLELGRPTGASLQTLDFSLELLRTPSELRRWAEARARRYQRES